MITTLTGPNNFLLQTELRQRVEAFVKQNGDMALERLDGEEADYQRLVEAVQSLPFLSSSKLVVLSRPGAQKAFAEEFSNLIETIPETNDVIIIEPKLDKRTAYYKTLKAKTEFKEFNELDPHRLSAWLVEEAKQAGGQLQAADARYLIDRVGASQQLLSNELQKLLTYNPKVTRQTIDELTDSAPQSTVFQLLDAAFAGDKARVLKLYQEQRSQRVEPLAILAMLAWQLHIFAVVKSAGDRYPADIAKQAGLSPFVVQKSLGVVRRLSLVELKKLIRRLHQLDVRLKSTAIDPDEALQEYLLSIA